MPEILDTQTLINRDNMERRGLDPDFRYPAYRFATLAALSKNIPHFVDLFRLNFIGFLFLTFRTPIAVKEARKRFNNVWRRFFREIFGHWICVVEFTKGGRIHFHLLVQLFDDIRTGFGFPEYALYKEANRAVTGTGLLTCRERRAMRDAIPANEPLRRGWQLLDDGLTDFGFGPIYDLFPVETNGVGVSRYLTKQFLGGLPRQTLADKGAHLVSYSKGCPRAVPTGWRPPSPRFEERLNVLRLVFGFPDRAEFRRRLGSRWAYGLFDLMSWLEFDLGEHWFTRDIHTVTVNVIRQIQESSRLNHFLGDLLPDAEATALALYIPPGPPVQLPPPGSIAP